MTQLIKNDDGSYAYGDAEILKPYYNNLLKKHVFHVVRSGYVSAVHYGNHLTLKNSIKSLVEGLQPVENTEPLSEAVEAPSEAPEAPAVYESTDPLIVALKVAMASGSDDDYWAFKEVLDQEIGSFC
jgi:hypothetical protein